MDWLQKSLWYNSSVEVLIRNIGMRFGLEIYDLLLMQRGKAVSSWGLEMSVGEKIKEVQENGHKYLRF